MVHAPVVPVAIKAAGHPLGSGLSLSLSLGGAADDQRGDRRRKSEPQSVHAIFSFEIPARQRRTRCCDAISISTGIAETLDPWLEPWLGWERASGTCAFRRLS
jgi:hypothetical protein